MYGILILALTLIGVTLAWWRERKDYDKQLSKLKIRIYVNGIRGKSTVTRLIAGVLREAGIQTLAKTTGSAAMVILPNGDEIPIQRRSSATIMELFNIAKQYLEKGTEAIVFETMALFPANQTASQELLVKGNINVITNVREDHQDVMGESLEEIADTLSLMIPHEGILITAEDRHHLRERLRENAQKRGSELVYADPARVTEQDLAGFNYLSFRENISIGLAVAQILGIPRSTAMRGMRNARPDLGVSDVYILGWTEGLITKAILEKAAANGDMTRAGILAAANEVEVDFNGLAPPQTWSGEPNDQHIYPALGAAPVFWELLLSPPVRVVRQV